MRVSSVMGGTGASASDVVGGDGPVSPMRRRPRGGQPSRSGRASSTTSQCASSSSNRRRSSASNVAWSGYSRSRDLGVAVLLDRRPVAVRDRHQHVPVRPALAVEPRRPQLDVRVPAGVPLLLQDRPVVPPEQLHELVVGAPPGPVEVQDLDGLGSHRVLLRVQASSRAAASRSSAHARSTWRGSVRRLPMARRIVNRSRSRVWRQEHLAGPVDGVHQRGVGRVEPARTSGSSSRPASARAGSGSRPSRTAPAPGAPSRGRRRPSAAKPLGQLRGARAIRRRSPRARTSAAASTA